MIEEQGTVVAREGSTLWVETTRRGTCGGCSQGAGCGVSLFGRLFASGQQPARTRRPAGCRRR